MLLIPMGDDVTGEAQEVQDIAAALWTEEVIAAYQASIAPPAESAIESQYNSVLDPSGNALRGLIVGA